MKKIEIVCLLCLMVSVVSAQSIFDKDCYTKDEAGSIIDFYFNSLEEWHPNLYYYHPKEKFDSCIIALKAQCYDFISKTELRRLISHTKYLHDEHSGTEWRFGKPFISEYVFPRIYYKDRKVYLESNDVEIRTINSVPVESFSAYLRRNFGADVVDDYFGLLMTLNREFCMGVNDFDIHSPYRIEGVIHGRDTSFSLVGDKTEFMYKDNSSPMLIFDSEIDAEAKIAIAHYNSMEKFWSDFKGHRSMIERIRRFFRECRKNRIQHLFIDVSKNGGGYGVLNNFLLMFLPIDKDKTYVRLSNEVVTPNYVKIRIEKVSYDTIKQSRIQFQKRLRQEDNSVYELMYDEEGCKKAIRKKEIRIKPFKGQIWICQSPNSQSATPGFCAAAKVLTNAILIGTPTGSGLPLFGSNVTMGNERLFRYTVSRTFYKEESPQLPRTKDGRLLPDMEYPMPVTCWLNIEDCKKIIELYSKK